MRFIVIVVACIIGFACALPDLLVQQDAITPEIIFFDFDNDSCAVADRCINTGTNVKILRYASVVANTGDDVNAGAATNASATFIWSACSEGFHRRNIIRTRLLNANGREIMSATNSMCLFDTIPYNTLPAGGGPSEARFDCDATQGISRGWRVAYRNTLNCQWLDITTVPNGEYILSVEVNNARSIQESDFTNNVAQVRVAITDDATAYPVPPNDEVTDAIEITPGNDGVKGTTLGATLDEDENSALTQCMEDYGGTVWYRVNGTGNTMRASTCHRETSMDTYVAVFSSDMTCIASNDDAATCGVLSQVSWDSDEDDEYYIAVSSYYLEDEYEWPGNFKLTIMDNAPAITTAAAASPAATA